MSAEKNRIEASRWLRTAQDDLRSASVLFENKQFAHACFHAQQTAEKAIKALWYFADADPWGHSIRKLIDDLESVDLRIHRNFLPLIPKALVLDRLYIPTRYPNGLPDITPNQAFITEDAQTAIANASEILAAVQQTIAGF
jgi:HEPN domain-containing protein